MSHKDQKILISLFLLVIPAILISGCDSRRNQIIRNLIISPTLTETPVPPTSTPTVTPTPAPTLTPTPFISAHSPDLLFLGDFDKAEYDITKRIEASEDPEILIQAQTDLIELAWHREDYDRCLDIMTDIKLLREDLGPESDAVFAKASYIHAQCAEMKEMTDTVIEDMGTYLDLMTDSSLQAELHQKIAYGYHDLGDYELFRSNIDMSRPYLDGVLNETVLLDYAYSYSLDGDQEEAVRQLTDLYNTSQDDNIKAGADYYLGIAYEAMGLKDQVIARYQDAVNSYPRSYYSYLALLWLIDQNQVVSNYQRGLVNYYVGQYSLANDAFRRYINSEPGHDGSSWYFIGICQMYMGEYDNAETSFSKLINDYPENRYYVSAWDELAYVQWYYQDRHRKAAETLTNYVKKHPDQADSASFIYEAGRILERGNYLTDAAKTWGRLIDEYPLYEQSKNALFLAAVSSYRANDNESALAYLNRLLIVSGIPEDQAQTNFWIGKVYLKKDDNYNAQKYLDRAIEQEKTGYYSLRAAELKENKDYLTLSQNFDFEVDLASERAMADQWMMLTFGLTEQALTDPTLYNTLPNYRKGSEYLMLGEYRLASICFDEVRNVLTEQPAAAYAFLDEMVAKKMYGVAAYTSRQILSSAGLHEEDRTLDVPNYFNHIRFGSWYLEYTAEAAQTYSVSPILLYALMKQESMFNPWISSSAGAVGLMQIMPETGSEISKTLHWPSNYTTADLNRVPVSVNFAASYLKRLNNYFDQSNAAMLAAYNGGSGNTQRWLNFSKNDPDLLYEIIRFPETKNYLHNIYRFAKTYDMIYAK